ncbi:MAG: Uncharacterized protein CEN89_274 [Candidatus Berkelbacteria bacterium Licking1014_7]|uniref:Uncharacterized protein n=1 Tax=Candidatus Berkelbacteria bacterium Licking1014_7 TaxID=2017147 RepID=A0A554LJL0_9BACT|nr:MAG: Uncharacterized protein CEN89_274 [Candidatus Berkelbacteria bacterium Licking1014_7]
MKFIDFKFGKKYYKKGKRIDYRKPKIDVKTQKIVDPKIRIDLILKIAAVVAVGVLAYWWLFLSSFFKITEIEIDKEASPDIVLEVRSLKGKNIFLFGGKKTEETLKQKQPGIQRIKIIRGLPESLRVELVERDSALTWQVNNKYYLVDRLGVVFKPVDKVKHFLIVDTDNVAIKLGDTILDQDFIIFTEAANQEIPLKTEFKITNFEIRETTYQLVVNTEQGKKIFLTTLRQINPQITALKKIYSEHKDEIREYIDLRVEGIAYYK